MLSDKRIAELKAKLATVAAMSKCKKRKVGALIVDMNGGIIAEGVNFSKNPDLACEDEAGKTLEHVIHAEVDVINRYNNWLTYSSSKELKLPARYIFVSHEPCSNCLSEIKARLPGDAEIIVAESFLKFDTEKLRYDLVPPSAMKGLAEVLTYGAKKYKPNNWREVDDTDRYIAALYRHLEAWRAGEKFDDESKLQHLKHAMTNIAFLLEFENNEHS